MPRETPENRREKEEMATRIKERPAKMEAIGSYEKSFSNLKARLSAFSIRQNQTIQGLLQEDLKSAEDNINSFLKENEYLPLKEFKEKLVSDIQPSLDKFKNWVEPHEKRKAKKLATMTPQNTTEVQATKKQHQKPHKQSHEHTSFLPQASQAFKQSSSFPNAPEPLKPDSGPVQDKSNKSSKGSKRR